MLLKQFVSRLWADVVKQGSNSVIMAELVFKGRPQRDHKAPTQVGAFFMRRRETSLLD